MKHLLLTRDDFRAQVFARDGGKCVFCGRLAEQTSEGKLDSHHIIDRRLFTANHEKGGYFVANGATVCEDHHRECEMTVLSCQDVRDAAGIKEIVIPSYFYDDQPVDKWGNPIIQNGMRLKGPLFYDESVQKILALGNVLRLFSKYVKHPRLPHLPWSEGMNSDDRRIETLAGLIGREVVVSIKMDGEQTSVYNDYLHARSIDGPPHTSRAWVKKFASEWQYHLSDDQRICGENLYAQHSIIYDESNPLPSYFCGFSMWDRDMCLGWDDTMDNFKILGVTPVPVIWRGIFDEKTILGLYDTDRDWAKIEGYVVRLTDGFSFNEFKNSVAKFVRKGHVQTAKHHWRSQRIIPNVVEEPALK